MATAQVHEHSKVMQRGGATTQEAPARRRSLTSGAAHEAPLPAQPLPAALRPHPRTQPRPHLKPPQPHPSPAPSPRPRPRPRPHPAPPAPLACACVGRSASCCSSASARCTAASSWSRRLSARASDRAAACGHIRAHVHTWGRTVEPCAGRVRCALHPSAQRSVKTDKHRSSVHWARHAAWWPADSCKPWAPVQCSRQPRSTHGSRTRGAVRRGEWREARRKQAPQGAPPAPPAALPPGQT